MLVFPWKRNSKSEGGVDLPQSLTFPTSSASASFKLLRETAIIGTSEVGFVISDWQGLCGWPRFSIDLPWDSIEKAGPSPIHNNDFEAVILVHTFNRCTKQPQDNFRNLTLHSWQDQVVWALLLPYVLRSRLAPWHRIYFRPHEGVYWYFFTSPFLHQKELLLVHRCYCPTLRAEQL